MPLSPDADENNEQSLSQVCTDGDFNLNLKQQTGIEQSDYCTNLGNLESKQREITKQIINLNADIENILPQKSNTKKIISNK